MAYTITNYKTKKALRDAVASGEVVQCFQPGLFATDMSKTTGTVYLEGPHYPKPHTWYATATLADGVVTKVK